MRIMPSYLKLHIHNSIRAQRSSKGTTLKVPLESSTFQDIARNIFDSSPSATENSVVFSDFKTQVREYLINRQMHV